MTSELKLRLGELLGEWKKISVNALENVWRAQKRECFEHVGVDWYMSHQAVVVDAKLVSTSRDRKAELVQSTY